MEHCWPWCLSRTKHWYSKPGLHLLLVLWPWTCYVFFAELGFLIYESEIQGPHLTGWNEVKYMIQGLAHRKPSIHFNSDHFLIHSEKGNRLERGLSRPAFVLHSGCFIQWWPVLTPSADASLEILAVFSPWAHFPLQQQHGRWDSSMPLLYIVITALLTYQPSMSKCYDNHNK